MEGNLNCIRCGAEAEVVRNNTNEALDHTKSFGLGIPDVEVLECDCGMMFVTRDGVLEMAGEGYWTYNRARIPAGCLVVAGEV